MSTTDLTQIKAHVGKPYQGGPFSGCIPITAGQCTEIAIVPTGSPYIDSTRNAERFAKCWNACQGFKDPEAVIRNLIAACKLSLAAYRNASIDDESAFENVLEEAITAADPECDIDAIGEDD
jgi:hypothetical protein